VFDACFPCIAFEREESLLASFGDRRELEEVASDDELYRNVINIDRCIPKTGLT